MINVIDLFKEQELKEKSNGDYQTNCPDCGPQGGRTEGFILFPETNTSYCHSSHKWFTLLETAALKLGIIKCIEGNDSGEKPNNEEEFIEEVFDAVEGEYGSEFLTEFKISCGNYEDFLIININTKGKITKRVNIQRVANYLINKYDIKTVYGLKEESIYIYQEGIWNKIGKGFIKSEIENLLFVYATNNVVNEVFEKVKRITETSREEFDEVPEYKRCFINGVLDIENVDDIKFLPHSKDYNFKTKFPIKYNPESKCPKILKFINDTFYPDDISQVQEWFGHHLPKRYLFKKAVIVHGPKNTGKSVFLNLLTAFVGRNNITDISLQKISMGRSFDLLFLKDMFANIHDDLSSKDLSDGGGFKMAVGDGYIAGEEKFGDLHRFRNSAKMTFACNIIPPVKDINDDAYYDRWLPWKLDNIVLQNERNNKLITELTTEEEMSGLLNWALEGYFNLIKRNCFLNEKDSEEVKSLMVQHGNPLAKFVSECLEESPGSKITKDEMYNQYCHFCLLQNPKLSPCSKEQLGRQLTRFAGYALASKSGTERYWLNVNLNLCVNGTLGTLYKKPYSDEKVDINSDTKVVLINFPKVSQASQEKSQTTTTKTVRKISDKKTIKKKTDREVQFMDAKECKDIKPKCTKKQIEEWIKNDPEKNYKEMYKEFGIGCFKFRNELKREGVI